jgi:hypothetical protein
MSRLPIRRANFLRYPDNLNEQDEQTYRRWVRGLLVFYAIAIALAVAADFAYRPAGDLTASIDGATHRTADSSRSAVGTSIAAEKR